LGGLEALLALARSAYHISARPHPLLAARIGPGTGARALSKQESRDRQLVFLAFHHQRNRDHVGSLSVSPSGSADCEVARTNGSMEAMGAAAGEVDSNCSGSRIVSSSKSFAKFGHRFPFACECS